MFESPNPRKNHHHRPQGQHGTSEFPEEAEGLSALTVPPPPLTMYEGKMRTRLCLPQGHWGSSRRFGS